MYPPKPFPKLSNGIAADPESLVKFIPYGDHGQQHKGFNEALTIDTSDKGKRQEYGRHHCEQGCRKIEDKQTNMQTVTYC